MSTFEIITPVITYGKLLLFFLDTTYLYIFNGCTVFPTDAVAANIHI